MGPAFAKAAVGRPWLVAGLLVSLASCGKDAGSQAAAAAIGIGAAVAAAAINRAVTDECWGSCPPGTYCDESSGLCIAPDESTPVPAEDDVEWVECDGAEFECKPNQWLRCERRCEWVMCGPGEIATSHDSPQRCCRQPCTWLECYEDGRPCEPAASAPTRKRSGAEAAVPEASAVPLGDPCRGLCLPNEQCVVRDAVADCVARAR